MLRLLILLFVLLSGHIYSQTVSELEDELSILRSGEKEGSKIKIAKLLLNKEPFNRKATSYICRYYKNREIDSVNIFFDNLIAEHPNQAEPYVLRSEFVYYQNTNDNKETEYLKKALQINPDNIAANYSFAEKHYRAFIFPTEVNDIPDFYGEIDSLGPEMAAELKAHEAEMQKRKHEQKPFQKDNAEKALTYFEKLWSISPDSRKTIYFPIKQLECFLKIDLANKYVLPENLESFFPIGHFTTKIKNWECDFTINYLFEIELENLSSEFIKEQLTALKEPNLFRGKVSDDTQIYRFTALPSFDHPVCITVEKKISETKLYWSIGKGAGGYTPKGIKKSGKKNISQKKWKHFIQLFEDIKYSSLPNSTYVSMTDGTQWLLEYKTSSIYEAKETNFPSKAFSESFLYLVKLAKIKLEREDAY